MKIFFTAIMILIVGLISVGLTSCQTTNHPDGSSTVAFDPVAASIILEMTTSTLERLKEMERQDDILEEANRQREIQEAERIIQILTEHFERNGFAVPRSKTDESF